MASRTALARPSGPSLPRPSGRVPPTVLRPRRVESTATPWSGRGVDERAPPGVTLENVPKPLVIVERGQGPDHLRVPRSGLHRDGVDGPRPRPARQGLNVDVDNGFKVDYEVNANKKEVIRDLGAPEGRRRALPAPDEDEGEAIGRHLLEVLKPRCRCGAWSSSTCN